MALLGEEAVRTMLKNDAFSNWLGVELVAVGTDAVVLRMKVRNDMLNGFGVCHGGVTFAFADSALAFTSNQMGKVTVSIDNHINYPAQVRAGDVLTATSRELSRGTRLAVYEVTVFNQKNRPVGLFHGTVYITEKEFGTRLGEVEDNPHDTLPAIRENEEDDS